MNQAGLDFREHGDRTLIATVSGEIDSANADGIRAALTEAVTNHSLALILDLSAVDYLDSAGIELLYRLREDLRSRGQDLHVVIPSGSPASSAVRLAGVAEHLEVEQTLEEAVRLRP